MAHAKKIVRLANKMIFPLVRVMLFYGLNPLIFLQSINL